MVRSDNIDLKDDHKKWAEWSLEPKKRPRKMTDIAAGFVVAFSAFVTCDAHQYLNF